MLAGNRWGILFIVAALAGRPALAQAPPLSTSPGGIGDPGSARQTLPELPPAPPPQPNLVLPPVAPPPPAAGLSRGPRVYVREVRLEGNTALPDNVLAGIVRPFLERELGTGDLEELRRRLTLAYVERGYINSGAVLPDQQVTNGIVTYQLVEGKLSGIEITGNATLRDAYIRNRLERGAGVPLNINDIERRLQLLLQDPMIARMNVELVPGVELGEARLRADVVEGRRYSLTATIANDEPPNVGGIRGELYGIARNFTGWGDALALRYGRTEGVNIGGAAWAIPITADDTIFSLKYDRDDASVVSETFRGLDITSRTETIGVALTHPIYRTPQQTLTLGLAFDRRDSRTTLLGEGFSFTPGVENGTARVSVLRVSQDWLDRTSEQVLALRSTFSFGLDLFDATVTQQRPTGEFMAWLGQAQYVRQVHPLVQLVLRSDVQLTRDPLFPLEQVAIGGASTVRGYRENTLVRDNAVILSAEARVPVWRSTIPWFGGQTQDSVLQVAPFYDFGTGWNKELATPRPRDISSVGVGFRWELGDLVTAQLYYGYALRHIHNPDRDIQDSGIHFRISTRLY